MTLHPHGGKRTPGPGKKLGRPATGKTRKSIMVNIGPDVLEALDTKADNMGLSRSDMLNQILQGYFKT